VNAGTTRPRVMVRGLPGWTTGCAGPGDAGCDAEVYERSEVPLEGRGAGIGLNLATVRYFIETRSLHHTGGGQA
jgi:hypothetical protein